MRAADAIGKWKAILPAMGVSGHYLTGKHGPCPLCEDGKDRWRFADQDGKGNWYCSKCGAGDGFGLLMKLNGWDFKEALREVGKHVEGAKVVPIRQGRDLDTVRREMNAIWRAGKPLSSVEAAAEWWVARLGAIPDSTELRAVQSLHCKGCGEHPAMVARVMDAAGKPVNLHRTYLRRGGAKADVPDPRRVMDAPLPKGAAVRLSPVDAEMGIAEGIETAAACRLIFGIPTWAALNANNMTGFVPPETVRRLVIFGDCDSSFTGQAAAFELAKKLWTQREKLNLKVEVNIRGVTISPTAWDTDWNDELLATARRQSA